MILNIDFALTQNKLEQLGLKDSRACFGKYSQSGLFDKLDRGEIDQTRLFDEIRKLLPDHVSDKQLLNAWNSMILDFPEYRIEFLKKIRKKFRIALLSNTNVIHYRYYSQKIKIMGEESLESIFDHAFYSFRMGMRKPEKRIFMTVAQELETDVQKILFVDDTLVHISAAVRFGFQTLHIDDDTDVCDKLLFLFE